jgi:indolepyruvate ferredoxin oxidoreductase, beta subunit
LTDRVREAKGRTRSVLLAGVGGQGTILAANLLAQVMLGHGYDVKTSEVHGMAQRGGSVVSMVRFGTDVASPLVPRGEADAVIATELLEALRNVDFLAPGAKMIVSAARVDPLPVLQGVAKYPEDAILRLGEVTENLRIVDAAGLAAECGDARAANTVLLGIASRDLPVESGEWISAIEEMVPEKAIEANVLAFKRGREL